MMPRIPLIGMFALAGLPILMGLIYPDIGQLGVFATMLVFVFAVLDLLVSPSLSRVEVQREAGEVISVGARNPVRIWVTNRNRTAADLEIHDEPPAPCSWEDLPALLHVPANATRYFGYHVTPHQRGKKKFGTIYLQCRSRFGLWTLHAERPQPQPVQVYPDIQAVAGVELLARQNRLAEAGVRMSRLKGRGSDFDRLREYRREDEYRSIDWKATARHQSLISREYVVERNQNILFVLDSGRSMCNQFAGISHFDRALNAAILLSYIALRQGDTVGLMAFSNQVDRWVPPVRGANGIQPLISQVYDLNSRYEASDYELMVEQIRLRYRKRSLVIMLTHALDEVHLDLIGKQMRRLKSPHLVLGALLRNVELDERLNSVPTTAMEAFQVAAAAEMVAAQSVEIANLQNSGLLLLEATPDQLSSRLISQYLEIKARHLL